MMRTSFLFYLFLSLNLISSAFAHQQKESYTTILFNERTGNLEVMHRFYLHDAEHAVASLLKTKGDIYHEKKIQEQFAHYVFDHFAIKQQENNLPLKFVGFETEGKYLWVYSETLLPKTSDSLSLKMDTLQEIWHSQTNHINIEKSGKVRSIRLHQGDAWQTLSIDP